MFNIPDSLRLDPGLWGTLFTLSRLTLHYFLFAGGAYLLFYVIRRRKWLYLRIQEKWPREKAIRNEVKYSLLSIGIFALLKSLMVGAMVGGYSKFYTEISEYGWGYLLLSIPLLILMHDTWFYWIHRFMHLPKVFKRVHKVHHRSHNPTPLAAFSFHPLEAILEFGFLPLVILLFPIHIYAIALAAIYQIVFNVLGHLGYELFPKGWTRMPIGKWFNTSTHHNMHHKHFDCNYGFYFNIWDRLMRTNHPEYHEKFDAIKERQRGHREEQHAGKIVPES